MSYFHLRREAENLEHGLRVIRDLLRGQLASLLAILGEDSDLLRGATSAAGVVWILPLILIERSQDNNSGVRGPQRRRLIEEARRDIASILQQIARATDPILLGNLTERLYAARRRLRRLEAGG